MDISHTIADPVQAFRCAIADAGMIPPDEIVADGKIHRFSPTGRRTDDAGWYVLHLDRLPAGAFGNWRDGQQQTWCAKHESRLSAVERRQLAALRAETRKQRDMEHVKRQGEAASAALARWESAQPVTRNPYLEAKGVGSYGVRAVGEVLLVPVRDSNGKLHSLQTIAADGTKRFMQGGRVRGCYHSIERPHGRVIVCEGYATGSYVVHLGSGLVQLDSGRTIGVLPIARQRPAAYNWSAEPDQRTNEIVNAVLLLATDDQITDPTTLTVLRASG